MAGNQVRLSIQGAVDELSRRKSAPVAQPGASYGQPYGPPRNHIEELRQQQAAFAATMANLDRENGWMAIPALAPAIAVLGVEGVAALAARVAAAGPAAPLVLRGREPWPLDEAAKKAIREQARKIWARANNVQAGKLRADVHHSDPLQWSHLKPNADPNRLANLSALARKDHAIASREWIAFQKALNGRMPTQAELMAAKMRIERLVEPLVRRPGLSRPNPPKGPR
jgi:hypothetical protein